MEFPKLTVAIPTMRRWNFLKEQLPRFLNSPYVDYVVICDETGEDIKAIRESEWITHPKLRLYKNPKRLGVYYNKRNAFERAPTDWVAVLDSDNYFTDDYFMAFREALQEVKMDPKYVFAAGKALRVFLDDTKPPEDKIEHFRGRKITKANWNETLQIKFCNFLLNDGNWIANKIFLNVLPDDVDDATVGGTDSIYMARKAAVHGFTYYVVPNMQYIHTVHNGSHWLQTERESTRLMGSRDWRI
jgi:glycosyltransferase involved in cell wall biosynthesis